MNSGTWWRLLGIGGLVGVAATGVVIARDQRKRTELSPDEVRDRLHSRLGDSGSDVDTAQAPPETGER